MILLERDRYKSIYELYVNHTFFFPLIAAVLSQEQDGVVYVNHVNEPSQIYVEHSFGFAQVFGLKDEYFEQQLEHYLCVARTFKPEKIRLYAPDTPQFLLKEQYEPYRSHRQRFVLDLEMASRLLAVHEPLADTIHFSRVSSTNLEAIEQQFNIVSRFWRNPADFIKGSNASVVYYNQEIASICYAAAQANGYAEIDVLTLPQYRNLGLAKHAVFGFINNCIELSLLPLWDCFINNSGSMMLCKSVGFTAPGGAYLFFTINK